MSRIADDIRKYISCHQFGDENYGEWGILTHRQRELIKELIETCNMFERTADEFGKANIKLKHQLALTEKALELACNDLYWTCSFSGKFTKEEFISRKIDYYTKKAKEIMKSE